MARSRALTLLDVIQAVSDVAENDQEIIIPRFQRAILTNPTASPGHRITGPIVNWRHRPSRPAALSV
jgi:hypothetical protein